MAAKKITNKIEKIEESTEETAELLVEKVFLKETNHTLGKNILVNGGIFTISVDNNLDVTFTSTKAPEYVEVIPRENVKHIRFIKKGE